MTRPKPTKAPKVRKPVRRRKKGKRANLAKQANELWSEVVKKPGRCWLIGRGLGHVCAGSLQAAHGFGKKAHPSVRYLLINGFPLCSRAHTFYTWQPHRWERFLREAWGEPVYEELYRLACKTVKHDFPAIIAGLREELAR